LDWFYVNKNVKEQVYGGKDKDIFCKVKKKSCANKKTALV